MSAVILIVSLVVLLTVVGAGAAWFLARGMSTVRPRPSADAEAPSAAAEVAPPATSEEAASPAFCWRNIAAPITILALTVILAGYFYRLLPDAEVAYRFQSDGSPDAWLSREAITLWMTLPQVFLTVVAAGIAFGVARLSVYFKIAESTGVRLDGVLRLVGNMMAIPQSLLFVAMLDIFSYNSYQVHILPLWILALIVLTVGSIILAVFFMRTVRQLWGTSR
jgi:uncharacterized membrane protein YecN with MAPEG domain